MFLDVVGTIIAFISILALLSVIVTTLVQIVQATLRLRARNLQMCLAGLIMKARKQAPAVGLGRLRGEALQAKREAAILLNEPAASPLKQVSKPESFWHYYISGPKVSWVEPGQLEAALASVKNEKLKALPAAELVADFKAATEHLKKRFQLICRLYTVALGVVVAVGFQVSTPETFSRLSAQSAAQQESLAGISAFLDTHEQRLTADGDAERTFEDLRAELDTQMNAAAGFGFEWWPDDNYYRDKDGTKFRNILGVLMTGALLSLGAPFWFEQLRNAIRFRDLLAGKAGMGEKSPNSKDDE